MRRLALILALVAAPAYAVQPDEVLDDPALESRARELSEGLRCLVCRNEDIDESVESVLYPQVWKLLETQNVAQKPPDRDAVNGDAVVIHQFLDQVVQCRIELRVPKSLIVTAKLDDIDAQAGQAAVLARLPPARKPIR